MHLSGSRNALGKASIRAGPNRYHERAGVSTLATLPPVATNTATTIAVHRIVIEVGPRPIHFLELVQKGGVEEHARPVRRKGNRPRRRHGEVEHGFFGRAFVAIECIRRSTSQLEEKVPVLDDAKRLRQNQPAAVALGRGEGVVALQGADDRRARRDVGELLERPKVWMHSAGQGHAEKAEEGRSAQGSLEVIAGNDVEKLGQPHL